MNYDEVIVDREQRLAAINAELRRRNLKELPKLGDVSKGEIEITGIKEIFDHSKDFFTDIKFATLFPNGKPGEFTVRFNANSLTSDGVVLVVILNGRFAIVKQWRLPLGRWTYEVPRGFGESVDSAKIQGALGHLKIADLPLGTLERELGEEVVRGGDITSITHLGNTAESSGTNTHTPANFLVEVAVDEDALLRRCKEKEGETRLELWDLKRVRQEIGGRICDNHSLAALTLASKYLDGLPR